MSNGVALHLPTSLVKDTLALHLLSDDAHGVCIEIRNNLHVFEQLNYLEFAKNIGLQIPLHNVPKGIQQVRVLDVNNTLLAERLFFAHYSKDNQKILVNTDKREYAKRDSVNFSHFELYGRKIAGTVSAKHLDNVAAREMYNRQIDVILKNPHDFFSIQSLFYISKHVSMLNE